MQKADERELTLRGQLSMATKEKHDLYRRVAKRDTELRFVSLSPMQLGTRGYRNRKSGIPA